MGDMPPEMVEAINVLTHESNDFKTHPIVAFLSAEYGKANDKIADLAKKMKELETRMMECEQVWMAEQNNIQFFIAKTIDIIKTNRDVSV